MDVLRRMQQAVREQKYRISSHANDEMANDFLDAADIENVIFTGKIASLLVTCVALDMKCLVTPLTTAVRM